MASKVLLVEDDNNLREIYQARLQAEGYDIVAARDGEEALVIAKQEQPDLIISDVMMPRVSGFEMLDILRNTEGIKDPKVIMLTALGQADDKNRADQLGADRYLVKSQVTLEDIVKAAQDLLGGSSGDADAIATGTTATTASDDTATTTPAAPVASSSPIDPVVADTPLATPPPVDPPAADAGGDSMVHKKVIQPISDNTTDDKPDLNTLLAREEAKSPASDAAPTAVASSSGIPQTPPTQQSPTAPVHTPGNVITPPAAPPTTSAPTPEAPIAPVQPKPPTSATDNDMDPNAIAL